MNEGTKKPVYKYPKARKLKIFFAALADASVSALLIFLIYVFGVTSITTNTQAYKQFAASTNEYHQYLASTSLYGIDSSGKLNGIQSDANTYIDTLIKTTYYKFNIDFITNNERTILEEKDCLWYKDNSTFVNDNLAQYYLSFRPSSDLPDNIKNNFGSRNNIYDYFYTDALKIETIKSCLSSEFVNQLNQGHYVNEVAVLNENTAKEIFTYLYNGGSDSSSYKLIANFYSSFIKDCLHELNENSTTYKNIFDRASNDLKSVYSLEYIFLFVTYFVIISITQLLIPVLLKSGRTIFMAFYKLIYKTTSDVDVNFKNILLKYILVLFTQTSIMIPTVLMSLSDSLLSSSSIFGFSFIWILILFGVCSLSSLLFFIFSPKNEFLPSAIAHVQTIDTTLTMEVKE